MSAISMKTFQLKQRPTTLYALGTQPNPTQHITTNDKWYTDWTITIAVSGIITIIITSNMASSSSTCLRQLSFNLQRENYDPVCCYDRCFNLYVHIEQRMDGCMHALALSLHLAQEAGARILGVDKSIHSYAHAWHDWLG